LATREATLKAAHEQAAGVEIDIRNPHVDQLTHSQAMPEGDQQHGKVANTVAPFTCCFEKVIEVKAGKGVKKE
jgi:hypothetical protein